jgi:hypothetical protein
MIDSAVFISSGTLAEIVSTIKSSPPQPNNPSNDEDVIMVAAIRTEKNERIRAANEAKQLSAIKLAEHELELTVRANDQQEDKLINSKITEIIDLSPTLKPVDSSTVNLNEEEDCCAICISPLDNKTLLSNCLHSFCYSCIAQWTEMQLTPKSYNIAPKTTACPLCKAAYTSLITNIQSDNEYKEEKVDFNKFRMDRTRYLQFENCIRAILYRREENMQLPSYYSNLKRSLELSEGFQRYLSDFSSFVNEDIVKRIAETVYKTIEEKQRTTHLRQQQQEVQAQQIMQASRNRNILNNTPLNMQKTANINILPAASIVTSSSITPDPACTVVSAGGASSQPLTERLDMYSCSASAGSIHSSNGRKLLQTGIQQRDNIKSCYIRDGHMKIFETHSLILNENNNELMSWIVMELKAIVIDKSHIPIILDVLIPHINSIVAVCKHYVRDIYHLQPTPSVPHQREEKRQSHAVSNNSQLNSIRPLKSGSKKLLKPAQQPVATTIDDSDNDSDDDVVITGSNFITPAKTFPAVQRGRTQPKLANAAKIISETIIIDDEDEKLSNSNMVLKPINAASTISSISTNATLPSPDQPKDKIRRRLKSDSSIQLSIHPSTAALFKSLELSLELHLPHPMREQFLYRLFILLIISIKRRIERKTTELKQDAHNNNICNTNINNNLNNSSNIRPDQPVKAQSRVKPQPVVQAKSTCSVEAKGDIDMQENNLSRSSNRGGIHFSPAYFSPDTDSYSPQSPAHDEISSSFFSPPSNKRKLTAANRIADAKKYKLGIENPQQTQSQESSTPH